MVVVLQFDSFYCFDVAILAAPPPPLAGQKSCCPDRDPSSGNLEPLTKPFNKAQADNGTRQRQQGEMDIQPSLETNS